MPEASALAGRPVSEMVLTSNPCCLLHREAKEKISSRSQLPWCDTKSSDQFELMGKIHRAGIWGGFSEALQTTDLPPLVSHLQFWPISDASEKAEKYTYPPAHGERGEFLIGFRRRIAKALKHEFYYQHLASSRAEELWTCWRQSRTSSSALGPFQRKRTGEFIA